MKIKQSKINQAKLLVVVLSLDKLDSRIPTSEETK